MEKDNRIRKGAFGVFYILFIVIGVIIAQKQDDNSLLDYTLITLCYVMLMTSPVTLGRAGTIISVIIITSSFVGIYKLAWVEQDPHFLFIYAFNTASLISLIAIDSLYRKSNNRAEHYQSEAITDGMTGLFNRRYFESLLDSKLKQYRKDGTPVSLIVVDVDEFKEINDTMGHDVGDLVLSEIAGSIKRNIRETDIPCRIGGDEFAVILAGCKRVMVERVISSIQNDLSFLNNKISFNKAITISVGGALSSEEINRADDLFKEADKALYAVKENGRNGFHIGEGRDHMSVVEEALQEINS